MSGTVCSYKGCSKSYSTDKEVSFFRFPDDPKRRKKWMEICECPELLELNDRQLRLKRVCSDHFAASCFMSAETRNQLTDKAIPLTQKESDAAAKVLEAINQQLAGQVRKRGRPPKTPKLEPIDISDFNKSADSIITGDVIKENGERFSPEHKRKKSLEPHEEKESRGRGRPPKFPRLVAVNSDSSPSKTKKVDKPSTSESDEKSKTDKPNLKASDSAKAVINEVANQKSSNSKKSIPHLSIIDEVVSELKLAASKFESEFSKKKGGNLTADEKILMKRVNTMNALADEICSDDDFDDEDSEDSEVPERANREFETFQSSLRKTVTFPTKWSMGGVIWDPSNKTKVIAISEPDVQLNGQIRLKKAIQLYEDKSVRVSIDGIDMTLNYGVQNISSAEDIGELIKAMEASRICCGIDIFQPDDLIYFPYAKKRGCVYYADACPIILNENITGDICAPCQNLLEAVINRKAEEKKEMDVRKSRPMPVNLRNDFGKSLYGLLNEMLQDSFALKSDSKEDREAVLSKYSTEISVMSGDLQKPEKVPHVNVSVDEVSASFRDIVSKLGFSKANAPKQHSQVQQSNPVKPRVLPPPPPLKPILPPRVAKSLNIKSSPISTHHPVSVSRTIIPNHQPKPVTSSSFSLGDGQAYEIVGEVSNNDVVQMLDLKGNTSEKQESIEIIEVDDETMAKLTAQNSGLLFQNNAPGGIQVATLDTSDPNISQILKSITPQS